MAGAQTRQERDFHRRGSDLSSYGYDEAPFTDEEFKRAGQEPPKPQLSATELGRLRRRQNTESQRAAKEAQSAADRSEREAERAGERARSQRVERRRAGARSVRSSGRQATKSLGGLLTGQGAGGTAAGTVLGIGLFCMLRALISGGPPEVWGWLKAKFINEPYAGASTPASSPSSPSSPSAGVLL